MPRSLSILVHGLPKAGKSTLVTTAPKPLLYIDVEGGSRFLPLKKIPWEPLRYAPPECTDAVEWDTAVITVREYREVSLALRWLESGNHCFRSVAIDSGSELQQRLIDDIGNREAMDYAGWGKVFRDFSGLVRDFHRLTEHPTRPLDIVAMVGMSKESRAGKLQPFAQGQSKTTIPYVFDVVASMEALPIVDPATGQTRNVHRLTTGPHPMYETGERVGGRIPSPMDDPTLPKLLDYVFGPEPSTALSVDTSE